MKPFAHDRPHNANYRKPVLLLLAAASLSIWYFDLVPQLVPVDTGHLDSDQQFSDSDFLALLDSPAADAAPDVDPIVVHRSSDSDPNPDDDSLLAALASQAEPIENSFPEFANLRRPTESSAEQMAADLSHPAETGIQQTGFEQTRPAFVSQAVAPVVLSPKWRHSCMRLTTG